jgi:hypothetical protein
MKFRATIGFWRPERASGLAVADIPNEHKAPLGGLKRMHVQGTINGAQYVSNVMPAEFEIERVPRAAHAG